MAEAYETVMEPPTAPETAEIEVGAVPEEGLRLWCAREATRHGELKLSAQALSKQAFESRAAALLGWIVASSSLIAATAVGAHRVAVFGVLPLLIAAAIACVLALWPRAWVEPGYNPRALLWSDFATEIEQLESLATGYALGIEANEHRLRCAASYMRAAFTLLVLAPVAAGLALIFP